MDTDSAFITYFIIFGIVAGGHFIYTKMASVEYQKENHKKITLIVGGLILASFGFPLYGLKAPLPVAILFLGFGAFIIYLNYKFTKYCLNCKKVTQSMSSRFCPKCGKAYE